MKPEQIKKLREGVSLARHVFTVGREIAPASVVGLVNDLAECLDAIEALQAERAADRTVLDAAEAWVHVDTWADDESCDWTAADTVDRLDKARTDLRAAVRARRGGK